MILNNNVSNFEKINKDIAIKVSNLNFKYGHSDDLVLNDINFEIKAGEFVVFVGNNGSGKSTVAKLLAGVLKQQDGIIEIFGNEVNKDNKRIFQKIVGIIFDNPDYQLIGATVKDDIIFGLENYNIEPNLMDDISAKALKKVDLEDYANFETSKLSGGQKQKAALATILANDPEIIIFDEAMSMLDEVSRKQIQIFVEELRNEKHRTIITISHDMEDLRKADKIFVFNNSRLVKIATYDELIENPEILLSNNLKLPFSCQLSFELQKLGVKLKTCDHNDQSLSEELCSIIK
ncbi:hypothetical protein CJJ23_00455 [Mycoplasmopsis agassizii]|uniref:ABC transporter domain-containing protein n=1 Tax=Mycoplasmopsis agassizii TaxID=33922 RepID=A0A269TJV6_9BACT|nr:hypothetical protein CJJ23_00455 [Mycoplasmopsis agassizii]